MMSDFDSNELYHNHKIGIANIIYTYLTRYNSSSSSNIQEIQTACDQFKTIYGYSVLFIQKPLTTSDVVKLLSGPYHHHWINFLFDHYENNAQTNIVTVTILI